MSTKKPAQEQELSAREEALAAREEALENDLSKLNIIRSRLNAMDATEVFQGRGLHISELGKDQGKIEMVEGDPLAAISAESFMNEPVMVNVFQDGMSGSLDVITVTVNGVNQPIIRGRDQVVKRKYVEALARSRITNYVQEVADPNRPENIQMKPQSGLTYPFAVREDRNPRGQQWLENILRQPG